MSSEEVFVQQFAKLFVHYRDVLTLDIRGENSSELQALEAIPAVELDRMISAARLAVLEIETNAREQPGGRLYYAEQSGAESELDGSQRASGLRVR
jgi:hypothetical protein